MSNVIENNYVVVKNLDYDEFWKSKESHHYSFEYYGTDIFNKSSRTTVCFEGAYNSKVMYCENCDDTHCNHMAIEVELREYTETTIEGEEDDAFFGRTNKHHKAHISKVTCKKCGSVYNLEDIRIINHARFAQDSSIRLVYDKIYDDGDEFVKFSIKTCSMVVERAFYSVDNKYKIIFNTKTGQTYLYNNPANKKNKVRVIPYKLTLENINLSARNIDYVFRRSLIDCEDQAKYKLDKIKEIYNLIYEKISNNLGYKPKTLEEYAKEFNVADESDIYSFEILALFNRFPNMNPFGITSFFEYGSQRSILRKMRAIKNTSKEPLLELSNAYKVKHFDLFKKYFYSEEPKKLYWLIYFSMFLDNKDCLEKILKKHERYNYITSSSYDTDELIKSRYSLNNAITLFLKDIRKIMSEEDMYLLLEKVADTYRIYEEIKKISSLYYVIKKKFNCKVNLNMQYICNLLCGITNESDVETVSEVVINYMYKELNKATYNKNKKKFKFKLNTLDEYRKLIVSDVDDNNILVSNLYDSIPHFNPYVLAEVLFGRKLSYGTGRQYEELEEFDIKNYIKDDRCDILGELFKEFNIPNVKSLRNKILKNPRLFTGLAFYSRMFTDVNVLNNILDSFGTSNKFNFDLSEIKEYFSENANNGYILEYIQKITEHLISVQGETIAAKKIAGAYASDNQSYLRDIWPMYENHLELYPGEPVDLTGNIREIHDRLVGLTGGTSRPFTEKDFKPFKYTKIEKELNTDINGYSFRLAHDGRELAILGNDLKNCVRGYVDRARSKNCYIVAVTYNDEYKICIELTPINKDNCSEEDSSYNYKLHQAKLYANTPVSRDEEALGVVLEWMEMNHIKGWSSDLNVYTPKTSIHGEQGIGAVQLAPAIGNLALDMYAAEVIDIDDDDDLPF